jgi:putative membrane protein
VSSERVLVEAAIAPNAVRYQVLAATAGLAVSIAGILFLPVVVPLVYWYYGRFYRNLRVVLTTRDLKVHRGILIREEKAIPLEKITDLAVVQGPIMRRMGLKAIKVETAGQSSGPSSALVNIVGLADTDGFRDLVLRQRDRIAEREDAATPAAASPAPTAEAALLETLRDIRDTLRRIESGLKERAPAGR